MKLTQILKEIRILNDKLPTNMEELKPFLTKYKVEFVDFLFNNFENIDMSREELISEKFHFDDSSEDDEGNPVDILILNDYDANFYISMEKGAITYVTPKILNFLGVTLFIMFE